MTQRTATDLADHKNRRECGEEFRRARDGQGSMSMAVWAAKWGESIVAELHDPINDNTDELAEAEKERDTAETLNQKLLTTIDTAAERLAKIADADTTSKAIEAAIDSIIRLLEGAVEE